MVTFCEIEDVNDLLGKKSLNPEEFYIVADGTIEPATVTRLITRRSGVINEEHSMNFNSTAVVNEYHDINAIPRIELDKYPLISIQSLSVWNGSEYVAQSEGLNRNDDDFYIDDAEAAFVGFWRTPSSGKRMIRISYTYGYSTIPSYVEEVCAKMVAIDVSLSQAFSGVCKESPKKWNILVTDWLNDIEELLNTHIRLTPLSIKTVGRWRTESFVQQLELMTGVSSIE